MKELKRYGDFAYIFSLAVIVIILYLKPFLSNLPLGLDSLAHLSKISYIKEFGFTFWHSNWYSGTPLFQYYPPLFYVILSAFGNSFFGCNLLVVGSIFLFALFSFLLVKFYTNNSLAGFVSALFLISVLNTSYYYIVVGNLPYVFALFFLPACLYFLENYLRYNHKKDIALYSIAFLGGILSHIFVGICIGFFVFIRLLFENEKKKRIFSLFSILIIPILLSSFWLIPFLSKSSSFVGEEQTITTWRSLFGFGESGFFGSGYNEIGLGLLVFVVLLLVYKKIDNKNTRRFILVSCVLSFLLLLGVLGKFYPTGIGSIRFISIFSFFMCVYIGIAFYSTRNLSLNRIIFLVCVFSILLAGQQINASYNYHSYSFYGNGRYDSLNKDFFDRLKFLEDSSDYRFGVFRFPIAKSFNYFYPNISQTSGYYDQGILYPEIFEEMKEKIFSGSLNDTTEYLKDFGIKYFEISGEYQEYLEKFNSSQEFRLIEKIDSNEDSFWIFEYLDAEPLIYLDRCIGNLTIINKSPDFIDMAYTINESGFISIKYFYHNKWTARYSDGEEIEILRSDKNMMKLPVTAGQREVRFEIRNSKTDYLGYLLTFLGFLLLVLECKNKRFLSISRQVSA